MIKRWMHKRERYYAMLTDNRIVRPFEWGVEHVVANSNGRDPRQSLRDFAAQAIRESDDFFSSPLINNYQLLITNHPSIGNIEQLTWTSAVETPSRENNTALAHYFPHKKNRRGVVVILPHWNAQSGSYFDLARLLNRLGLSALRLTLPYHEDRMPPELERADHLVSPNVGRSLQSIRQAVLDTRAAVRWLKQQGYERVGIVGTSIGSCVAFMTFVHDADIDAAVFNHVSGYMADVVWHGLSTYHVREGFGDNITLDELRECWLPVSPMAYMDRLAAQDPRPARYIYTKYDLSFPLDLSLDVFRELRSRNIPHTETCIPCGHYTLGEKPWNYIDGWKIVSFLRTNLR